MTTKLWAHNYKDAERDTWKMRVYRSLKTMVQLLFKLRWPQKNTGVGGWVFPFFFLWKSPYYDVKKTCWLHPSTGYTLAQVARDEVWGRGRGNSINFHSSCCFCLSFR